MTLHYRETDAVSGRWTGNTSGASLSAAQFDENTYTFAKGIEDLNAALSTSVVSLSSISQPLPNELTFHLSDGSSLGPFTIPASAFHSTGAWAPSTPHAVNDTFYINGAVYLVIFPDPGQSTFDASANDGLGHNYFEEMVPNPGNSIATGGTAGMVYTKTSSTDFAASWQLTHAVNVTFSPSTASGLVSNNVSDALEEIEALIGTGPAGFLPLSGGTLTGALTLSADPASALQPATKQYVDGIALNLGTRGRVRAATTANINLASALASGSTIDTSVTLATGDLVLVRSQSAPANNGIYVVPASGAASRSPEFAAYNDHPGSLIAVEEGTSNSHTIWLCTSNTGGTLGTTAIAFSQSSASGALLSSNNLSDVGNAGTARANLGLGTSATHALGDFALTSNNLADIANAASARSNLGLGSAATHPAGDFMQSGNNLSDLASAATARSNLGVATSAIEFVIDGGGSTITTGLKGYLEIPFACTITVGTLLGDRSGSVVVDVWKCSYANFDAGSTHPVSGDKITSSAPLTISTATKSQDSTLTGWTTSLSAGDIIAFNVNSVTSMQRVTVSLKVTR
jgi:hypothetical protein